MLVGPTYATRLWCVMELFTFIQMGGARERITVRELCEGARAGLAAFDAAKARCFLPKDKHKLLAVVEASFGDLRPFNRVVSALLQEDGVESTTTRRRSSVTGRVASRITRRISSSREVAGEGLQVSMMPPGSVLMRSDGAIEEVREAGRV